MEMCLCEQLNYDIKIKSRNCDLFVLKKNVRFYSKMQDFLRLSVNYKDAIEKFLQRSLLIYLRFNEDKKKVKQNIESLNYEKEMLFKIPTEDLSNSPISNIKIEPKLSNIEVNLNLKDEKENVDEDEIKDEDESLEQIIEENDEENDENLDEIIGKSKNNYSNEPSNNTTTKRTRGHTGIETYISENNSSNSSADDSDDKKTKPSEKKYLKKLTPQDLKEGKKKKTAPLIKGIKKDLSLTFERNKSKPRTVDNESGEIKEIVDDINTKNLKTRINKKFIEKLEEMLQCFIKVNIKFENPETNPILLLEKLRNVTDITERNEIVFKIDSFVNNCLKVQPKVNEKENDVVF